MLTIVKLFETLKICSSKPTVIPSQEYYTKFNVDICTLAVVTKCFLTHHRLDCSASGGMSGYTLLFNVEFPPVTS
ncbi:hypothetical protein F8M41_026051 [Gigaspora margarita]|uniref:Uncharacterized protein n=1 Tax=Gigaspora margarita TaxID=4874 RepID=A0A8H3XJ24_GIGMA|nr:hypothetical protein F8M41_026051 [Gigaspora margarita]